MASFSTSFASDENPLSAPWVNGNGSVYPGSIQALSGVARPATVTESCVALVSTPDFASDVIITATLNNWSDQCAAYIQRLVGGGDFSGYSFVAEYDTPGAYYLFEQEDLGGGNGNWTQLGSGYSNPTGGDVMEMEFSGNDIITRVNGSTAQNVTDGTYLDGMPGIGMYIDSGALTKAGFSDFSVDDGVGGSISVSFVRIPESMAFKPLTGVY